MRGYSGLLDVVLRQVGHDLQHAPIIQRDEWQAMTIAGSMLHETPEMRHVMLDVPCPRSLHELQDLTQADQPWAAAQFEERVSGLPWNPGKTYKDWPYHKGDDARHRTEEKFSHTYMERYFPRNAPFYNGGLWRTNEGIRFKYGDLNNLVHMLSERPLTRQAYLPVWFPEDLYAADACNERVPCTLGYHFLSDGHALDVDYFIRSCDYVRHLRNDIYMTCRLLQWVCDKLSIESIPQGIVPGRLVMHIGSLHYFRGDQRKMEELA